MQATVVDETPGDDGMVDLTIEMDAEFEAECRAAAAAVGKPVEIFLRDAIIAGLERRIAEEKARTGQAAADTADRHSADGQAAGTASTAVATQDDAPASGGAQGDQA